MFPRNEEGEVDVERGVYNANNQPKRATFKYEQEGQFCLGVAKVEGQDGKIIGKRCHDQCVQTRNGKTTPNKTMVDNAQPSSRG